MAHAEPDGFRKRVISALVLVPAAVLAAWLGGPVLAALVVLSGAWMGWEWARLTGNAGGLVGALVVLSVFAPVLAMALARRELALALVPACAAAVWLASAVGRRPAPLWAALAAPWIGLPCLACLWLAADAATGRSAILWLFVTVWATDTGAYGFGRWVGGPRLAPRLSPNKTWAGAVGGVMAAALVGWVAAKGVGASPAAVVPAGIGLSIAAQLGDLAESLAKRRFGVKDTGHLIPGHGGLLDRLDGMLAAAALQGLLTLAAGASPLAWQA